jgi:pimeloyl-ACP methyl ester carboxylesterase
MTRQRTLIMSAFVTSAVTALLLGLLPASAAPSSSVTATFVPKLAYATCPVGEELPPRTKCASLTVPLDWQTPNDGRTIRIAMRITTPEGSDGRLGLTWNPGGPGGEAIPMHETFYSMLSPALRDRFDVITWNPRGVGQSEPFLSNCKPVSEAPPSTGPVDWDAYWEQVAAVEGAATAACFAANPQGAPYLGTWQVVRDMDAMRSALGYPRWSYWGISYGTRLGNAYARTFPGKLRALIEDSSMMANESVARFGSESPASYHAAVQVYASLVGKRQAYKVGVIETYLQDSTINVGDVDLDRWTFTNFVNNSARNQSTYPQLKAVIDELFDYVVASGAGAGQATMRTGRLSEEPELPELDIVPDDLIPEPDEDNVVADPDSDTFIIKFVTCADMADRPTPADLAEMSRQAEKSYGTSYGVAVMRASVCFGLPSGYSPPVPSDNALLTLPNPPLFLLSTGDAATPWVWGRGLANTYAKSRTVTYNSTTHGMIAAPSQCVFSAAEQYLLDLKLPRKDVFCPYAPTSTEQQ